MLVNALRRFRESLRRVIDGAAAFLILTLFIFCLDKVSTDHAKLVPLGKVCTAKESLEKNTAKGTNPNLSLLSNMAALESCPKHNMIAYLEKTEGNVEFHEVIDFLRRSYIYHALTVPFEHQPDPSPSPTPRPSPTPSPTPIVPDLIPEPTGENLGDHSSNDTSLSGNEDDNAPKMAKITKLKKQAQPVIKHFKAYLKTVSLQKRIPKKSSSKKQRMHKKNVSKQGRKIAKREYISSKRS
ncbi:hypothetical protein Tco_1322288 [Tanacetum coccineum]